MMSALEDLVENIASQDKETWRSTAPRALIADDQTEVLEALRLLLKSQGYRPEVVTSPRAVIESLKSRNFDVLLMDLNYARDTTSGQEGLDLLAQVRTLDSTLPVIVMTGWGSVELAVEVMRRGVRDFVQKPWENERLLAVLRTHVEEGRALRKEQRLDAEKSALINEVSGAEDLHVLLRSAAERLQAAAEADSVVIFTRAPRDQAFWATAQAGITDDILGRLKFEVGSRILDFLGAALDPRNKDLPEHERLKLQRTKIDLILPMKLKGELIGFVGLGNKTTGEAYDSLDFKFLGSVTDQIGAAMEHLRVRGQEREFEEAREIQGGLLPKEIPQIGGHEIFGSWQPASAVGGDYFDIVRFSHSSIALCIADVAGKGMPAALLMSNLQAAVKAFASEWMQPRDIAVKVNRVICSNISANRFITFFYCLYNARNRKLLYTNAGHNAPVLLRRDGSHARLREGGAVLGVFPRWNYEQNEIELATGDRLVLFTDGVTEARTSSGEEFGDERLIGLLVRNRHLRAEELQQKVMGAVANFSGGEFQDDATLIVMSAD